MKFIVFDSEEVVQEHIYVVEAEDAHEAVTIVSEQLLDLDPVLVRRIEGAGYQRRGLNAAVFDAEVLVSMRAGHGRGVIEVKETEGWDAVFGEYERGMAGEGGPA